MKICTITCHDVYNYGASLQAYALQHYLQSLGHDVEIIDYKPAYLNVSYNFWYIPKDQTFYKLCKKSKVFHFLYALRLAPIYFRTWRRIFAFREFRKSYLKCTTIQYRNYSELNENPPKAHAYIAGSDQIWNFYLPNGIDPAWYLNFGLKETKRISYAASFGTDHIPYEHEIFLKDNLLRFDSISVREKSGLNIISNLQINNAKAVLDPVFLLPSCEWTKFIKNKKKINKYILLYNIDGANESLNKAVKSLREMLDCEVIEICGKSVHEMGDISIKNAGPCEFVQYISNADFVISDSFHATAFSVIFRVPFASFNNKNHSSRILDFLSDIGLQSRFNNIDLSPISDSCYVSLQNRINESKLFLRQSL